MLTVSLTLMFACAGSAAPSTHKVTLGPKTTLAAESGLELSSASWATDGAKGELWLVRAPRDAAVRIAPGSAVRPLAELVGAPAAPWAAINGGFYDSGPMGLVVSGGVEHTPLSKKGGSGVLRFGPAPARIVHRDAWTGGAAEALQSIDRLVDGGASLVTPRAGAHRDARSAVALSADHVYLVATWAEGSGSPTADGVRLQDTIGEGMTLAELAELLVTELHATEALNLDGAVSTQLLFATSTARWTLHGERGTINGVVVSPARTP